MRCLLILSVTFLWMSAPVQAQQRRAPRPNFSEQELRRVFFDSLGDAIRGQRPPLASLRPRDGAGEPAVSTAPSPGDQQTAAVPTGRWSALIGAESLEDEVKRIKLHFDSVVTTPTAFNSGGYQEARLDLTVLATLLAVIDQHDGKVRWKEDAAAARDLLARTAFNCKAGSTQVYNEAKLRKADLQDLLSGGGIAGRPVQSDVDWSMIADRAPLMEYADSLLDRLSQATNDPTAAEQQVATITRHAELIAMLGEVLVQEGMDDAADGDYAELSRGMTAAARQLSLASERKDGPGMQAAVGGIRKRCDACHGQYR